MNDVENDFENRRITVLATPLSGLLLVWGCVRYHGRTMKYPYAISPKTTGSILCLKCQG